MITVLCSQITLWKTETSDTPDLQVQRISPRKSYSFVREPEGTRCKNRVAYRLWDVASRQTNPLCARYCSDMCTAELFRSKSLNGPREMKSTRWLLRVGKQRDVYIVRPLLGQSLASLWNYIPKGDATVEGNSGKIISVNGNSVN